MEMKIYYHEYPVYLTQSCLQQGKKENLMTLTGKKNVHDLFGKKITDMCRVKKKVHENILHHSPQDHNLSVPLEKTIGAYAIFNSGHLTEGLKLIY